MEKKRLIVGISGASGIPLSVEMLRMIRKTGQWETHLVITSSTVKTIEYESDVSLETIEKLADKVYKNSDVGASLASGTFQCEGMIIVPCSMKTVAGIASGYSDTLLLRAADVTIKERRKLILMVRECPYSPIHLRNMLELSILGVDIIPLAMTFYNKPKKIEDMSRNLIARALMRFGIKTEGFVSWERD